MNDPPNGGSSVLPDGWSWGDVGHGLLDVAGLVPVYGEAADVGNAAWYASEGRHLEAGLSLISCVPVVGDVIGKGGKLAGKLGGPALKKLLPVLKKMDFAQALAPFRGNKKLGPHIDKMVLALNKWRDELIAKARGLQPCPSATKMLGESGTLIGKTPVPTRILEKLSDEQLILFQESLAKIEIMPIPAKGKSIFYSGKIGDNYAWEHVAALERSGNWETVNTLTKDALGAGEIRTKIPRDTLSFLDNLASRRFAETSSGDIHFKGSIETIGSSSVFRKVELPALLKNPDISEASKIELRNMKYFLDAKYGPG